MKIGELSRESGLSTHTIRYYEKIGLFHKAKKDDSGHRQYDSADLDLVNWVTCLKESLNNLAEFWQRQVFKFEAFIFSIVILWSKSITKKLETWRCPEG